MTDRMRKLTAGNPALDKLANAHLLGLVEPPEITNMAPFSRPANPAWSPGRSIRWTAA
jgi:hypothetical protein